MWEYFDKRYSHLTSRFWVACFPAVASGILIPIYPISILIMVFGLLISKRYLFAYSILFFLALFRGFFMPSAPEPLQAGRYTIEGQIVETPNLGPKAQRFTMQTKDRRIVVYTEANRSLFAGDWVRVNGDLRRITEPGLKEYWERRGINQKIGAMFTGSVEVIQPTFGFESIGSHWRNETVNRLRRNTDKNTAAIAMGVVAGQQGLVSKELYSAMQRTGTMHLLSTSGMNVLLVAFAVSFLLRQFSLPMPIIAIGILAVLLIYAAATGSRPPVIRASWIAAIFLLSTTLLEEKPDGISVLFLVATGILFVDPIQIFDVGFQLSFVCVFSMLLFCAPLFRFIERKLPRKRFWRPFHLFLRSSMSAIAVTLVASLGSAPIVATHFGVTSIISPIANLLTSIAIPFIYAGVTLSWLASFFSDTLSRGFDVAFTYLPCWWVEKVNMNLSQLPFAAIEYEPIPSWITGIALILILLMSRPPKRQLEDLYKTDRI